MAGVGANGGYAGPRWEGMAPGRMGIGLAKMRKKVCISKEGEAERTSAGRRGARLGRGRRAILLAGER